jgi:ATP-binding cassette subfamily C protein CydD
MTDSSSSPACITPPVSTGQAFLRHYHQLAYPQLWIAIGCNLINGVLLILQAWLLADVIYAITTRTPQEFTLPTWFWWLPVLFIVRAGFYWIAEHHAFQAGAIVRKQVRDQLYRHIQAAGPHWLSHQQTGALSEDLLQGVEALEAYYARYIPAMALTVTLPVAIVIAIAPYDWLSALILCLTAPFIPLFMILIGHQVGAINRRQWQNLARMGAHFLGVIQGLTTLKLFNASRREAALITATSDAYRRDTMAVLRVAFLSSAVLELLATVGIALVAVLIGFRLYGTVLPLPAWVSLPEINLLTGFFVLLLAPEFYLPLRNLGGHYHARMDAVTATERLAVIFAAPAMQTRSQANQPFQLPPQSMVTVQFQDVSFAYEAQRPALTTATFTLHPGERVALVGPSGAGKTTITSLLLGFIRANQGAILINGHPLNELDLATWRHYIAWLPQRPRLFYGTIRDNLCLGSPNASQEAIDRAAQRAQIGDFIMNLPDGYSTRIGDKGAGLSGGQIQRIALARVLLREQARLIILDEATASLDPATEQILTTNLHDLVQNGRTVLMIAHRLATANEADRVLVLDAGRIVQEGTPAQLQHQPGLYQQLIRAAEVSA